MNLLLLLVLLLVVLMMMMAHYGVEGRTGRAAHKVIP